MSAGSTTNSTDQWVVQLISRSTDRWTAPRIPFVGLACATADRVADGPRGTELAGLIRDRFGVIDAGVEAMAKAVVSAIPTQPLKIDNLRQQIARFR